MAEMPTMRVGDYGAECCWVRGTVNIRVDLREQIKFGAATRKLRGENTGRNEFGTATRK